MGLMENAPFAVGDRMLRCCSLRITTTVPIRTHSRTANRRGTSFTQLAVQISLRGKIGLIAQWLSGDTYWIPPGSPNRTPSAFDQLVGDTFAAKFVMLTRLVRDSHRLSLRHDDFAVTRDAAPATPSEHGRAWTSAYRYEHSARSSAGFEWLQIDSRCAEWADFYGASRNARARQCGCS